MKGRSEMADHNIISEVGEAIISLLREGLVPDIIPGSEGIGACHPSDRGDFTLGVCLYDVKRNKDITDNDRIPVGTSQLRSPSVFLDLYYMITAYSSSDIKFRSLEEAKMIGRTIQILEGTPVLRGSLFGKPFSEMRYEPRIELLELDNEEKNRIWNVPNQPYKLSLFYKVYPIELISEKITHITRVRETDFTVGQKEIKE